MKVRHIIATGLVGLLVWSSARADQPTEKDLKDKLMAIEKELQPIQKTAAADPDLKTAKDAVKAAQDKLAQAQEAAMIKADPKAKDLLEQRKKLRDELNALQKAEMEAKKKAPEKKAEKAK